MRYTLLLTFMLAGACLAGPATNIKTYITGFPDAHIAPLEGNGFEGTTRYFKGDDGKLFYVEIFWQHAFDSYCTERLKAAGMNDFEVELGRMSYEQQENQPGFQPNPDRVDLNFILHYKARPSHRDIHFIYMLPTSSQALGQIAGFSKLGQDKQTVLCVESVTADMKSIADQFAQRLKAGPIEVGPLSIPYDPASERTKREPSDQDYNLGFINKTQQNLYELSLSYGEEVACAIPDVVNRVKFARSDNIVLKIPPQTTLRWQEATGLPWGDSLTKHSVTLPLNGVVPRDFSKGTIYFVIRDHELVEVRPIKWADDKGSISLMREK